jgi:hypothetical protein
MTSSIVGILKENYTSLGQALAKSPDSFMSIGNQKRAVLAMGAVTSAAASAASLVFADSIAIIMTSVAMVV